jgi:hypothetical protein
MKLDGKDIDPRNEACVDGTPRLFNSARYACTNLYTIQAPVLVFHPLQESRNMSYRLSMSEPTIEILLNGSVDLSS